MSNFPTLSKSQQGIGVSDPVLFKNPKDDFRLLINAYVTGTVTYDIQYTIDPLKEQWMTLGDTSRSASSDESLYFPIAAVRVQVTSGTGTVKLVCMYKD